jgi:small-conductance mechanosensitive channel
VVDGRLTATAIAAAAAILLVLAGTLILKTRAEDRYSLFYGRRVVRFLGFLTLAVALLVIWKPLGGKSAVLIAVLGAGVAFASQELLGSIAGWFNILSGRIFRVGDRIEIAGIQGDVIDITPLRTKLMEIGAAQGELGTTGDAPAQGSWVKGRQYTGRIVAVPNKATFEEPVYNYSATFDFIWEELALPIPYDADWRAAEQILLEEARRASDAAGAAAAMNEVTHRYPVPRTEVEPQVYIRATDNWVELAARLVIPVRTARTAKNEMTHRVMERLESEGIRIASQTVDVTLREAPEATRSSREQATDGETGIRH